MRIIPRETYLSFCEWCGFWDSGRGPNQSVSRGMNRAEFFQVVFRAQNSTARSFRITFNRFKYQLMRFQKLQEEDSMAQVPWALGPWGMVLGEGRPAAICQGLESLGFRLQRLSLLEEVSPRGPRGATRNWDWGGVSSRTWLGSLMSHAISCDFIISHPYFGSLDGSVIFGMGASSIRGWVRDPSSAAGTSRRLHG